MLLFPIFFIPILGILILSSSTSTHTHSSMCNDVRQYMQSRIKIMSTTNKITAMVISLINLVISLVIFILFDFSSNQYQYVDDNGGGHVELNVYDIYLGLDGMSIYFFLLITIILPIGLLANWNSIPENVKSYLIIMLLLEILLLACFLVLDILMFYIFFESILPPLFIFIGLFGSSNKVSASFNLFLYTLTQQCKRAKHRENLKALK